MWYTRFIKNRTFFDKSMIIFTADHGSRFDDYPRDPRRHVPLIIKLPGQDTAYAIDKQFQNNRLTPIIELVMRGHSDEARVFRMIQEAE